MARRWFRRSGDDIAVRIPGFVRDAIGRTLDDMRSLLVTGNDELGGPLTRLFPTAYTEHPELDEEYQRFMRSELLASRLSSLETVAATIEQTQITPDEAYGWMQAVNGARVLIGSVLGIDHDEWTPDDLGEMDDDDPRFRMLLLYELLHEVLVGLIDVLSPDGFRQPEGFGVTSLDEAEPDQAELDARERAERDELDETDETDPEPGAHPD